MKKICFYALALVACAFLLVSCEVTDTVPAPKVLKDFSGLIVNQGNFSESNGSLSLYNEGSKKVVNLAYEKGNNGIPLGAIVESFVYSGNVGLAICNSPDKIVMVGMDYLQHLTAIKGNDVVTPRYGAILGSYAYVTCWGAPEVIGKYPGGWDILDYPNSYLLKIDLNSKLVVKKIDCKGNAEGVAIHNNKLYVGVSEGVRVFNLSSDTEEAYIKHTTLKGGAKHFAVDKNGKLWYSTAGKGFVTINTSTNKVESEIPVDNLDKMSTYIVANKDKSKILFCTNESNNWVPVKAEIYSIDVDSKAVSETPIYSGKQIAGIGVNPKTGSIYTAEIWNYGANSTLKVLNESGTLLHEGLVGVAASRFVFF